MNPGFKIKPHPSNTDMAGVYFDSEGTEVYLFAVPNGDILPTRDANYKNTEGLTHRSAEEAKAMAGRWLWRFENEEGFKESETAPI